MLEQEYKKIITFLNNQKIDYLVIGGIAVSVIGNPRETKDIDFCLFIRKSEIKGFLDKAEGKGFIIDKKMMLEHAKSTGCFYFTDNDVRIDFLVASHKLEKTAFTRKILIKMHGVKAYYPSPEDLILLKIIPGRLRDLADAEDIAKRHAEKLDKKYLLTWAQKLSDEAEDFRIYREIKKLLKFSA
ncbi:MAG: nucleotidyltransferase [Candidatus Omnitrophica bacterium]|nr:nucleotidyltransferase [Candidatus Omnitrophota bacterium]MCK4423031.1 nucleotidyltransferase [Candidatus Omnitrophota bacterium]